MQVGGVTYTSPVVYKLLPGKAILADARVKAGQVEPILFDLTFTVGQNVPDGRYPITIEAADVNNASGGYPATGEKLPILIGAVEGEKDMSKAFPVLPVTLNSGVIVVRNGNVDAEQDGIDDNWEQNMFGNLDVANAFTDWDRDGYSDVQEYLNQLAGETDPKGNVYNPKEKNAAGGTGYTAISVSLPWLQLLL